MLCDVVFLCSCVFCVRVFVFRWLCVSVCFVFLRYCVSVCVCAVASLCVCVVVFVRD